MTRLSLRNICNYMLCFRQPQLGKLNFADYVILNKSYFVVSWRTRNAHKITIRGIFSGYYASFGSMYIAIPTDADELLITFSNFWRSKKIKVQLKKVEVDNWYQGALNPKFQSWHHAHIAHFVPVLSSSRPHISKLNLKLKLPKLSTINLNYK